MIPSVESIIVVNCCTVHSARPEGVHNRALLTFENCSNTCTINAKDLHEKSMTYGTKFELLCNILQAEIPLSGTSEQ
jgi:hypothetical protein